MLKTILNKIIDQTFLKFKKKAVVHGNPNFLHRQVFVKKGTNQLPPTQLFYHLYLRILK